MPALAGENMVPASIPEESGFAESCSRSDHCLVAHGRPADMVQRNEVSFSQRTNTPGAGFEVVDQQRGRKMNLLRESGLLDHPREGRRFKPPVAHWARDAEARCLRTSAGCGHRPAP